MADSEGGPGTPKKCKRAQLTKNSRYYPPPLISVRFRRPRKISATTPPTESRRPSENTENFCYYPPPLSRVGFGDHGKIAATTPPTEPRRFPEITEKVCYYPPPLNRVDLALNTKGAPSL